MSFILIYEKKGYITMFTYIPTVETEFSNESHLNFIKKIQTLKNTDWLQKAEWNKKAFGIIFISNKEQHPLERIKSVSQTPYTPQKICTKESQ